MRKLFEEENMMTLVEEESTLRVKLRRDITAKGCLKERLWWWLRGKYGGVYLKKRDNIEGYLVA